MIMTFRGTSRLASLYLADLSSDRNRFWQAIIWQWTIWRAFKLQSTIWQIIFGQTIKRQRAFLPSWHLVKICLARYFWQWIGQSSTNWQLDKGPSINYVVSKSAIFDPLPLLVVFLLSKIGNFWPPPLKCHSLWTAPKYHVHIFHYSTFISTKNQAFIFTSQILFLAKHLHKWKPP